MKYKGVNRTFVTPLRAAEILCSFSGVPPLDDQTDRWMGAA